MVDSISSIQKPTVNNSIFSGQWIKAEDAKNERNQYKSTLNALVKERDDLKGVLTKKTHDLTQEKDALIKENATLIQEKNKLEEEVTAKTFKWYNPFGWIIATVSFVDKVVVGTGTFLYDWTLGFIWPRDESKTAEKQDLSNENVELKTSENPTGLTTNNTSTESNTSEANSADTQEAQQ